MYTFDAEKVKDEIVLWIRDFFEKNGKGCNAVVAVSGGKDSSVAVESHHTAGKGTIRSILCRGDAARGVAGGDRSNA